jgi:KDO2-lipid IV(A) lauroyltransferase
MTNRIAQKIIGSVESWAFHAYWNNFSRKDIDVASNDGSSLMRKLGPISSSHKTARRNIRLAFPKITTIEENEILDAMWDNLGRLGGELPHLGNFGYFTEKSRVKINGLEILDRYLQAGHGAVFASGHFANWEVMPAVIVQRGIDCQVTYREMNNPKIDKTIIDARAAYGVKLFAPKGREGGMRLMRILARGGSIAMMNDQKYNTGIMSPLFGHDCMTNDAAVRLAHRFKVPIQTMTVKRTGGAFFEVDVQEPMLMDFTKPLEEIVQAEVNKINAFIENKIREAPEQWFWVHKRWPKQAWISAGVM